MIRCSCFSGWFNQEIPIPMSTRTVVLLFTIPFFALHGAGEETRPGELLDALLEAAEVPPPRYPGGGPPHPDARGLRFEDRARHSAEELRAAAAHVAESNPAPEDPAGRATWEREATYKLRVIFAQYPLAARDRDDAQALLDLAGRYRSPEVLRVFLIRHAAPGVEPPSTFGNWLQGHVALDGGGHVRRLKELVQLPGESVPVQLAALDALLAHTGRAYAALLARGLASPSGEVFQARQLIGQPDAIPLSRETRLLLEQLNGETGRWARSLQALSANTRRDEALRAKAGEILAALLRDYPLDGREQLTAAP